MVNTNIELRREGKPAWFSRPGTDHLVQFYDHKQALAGCLLEYVDAGLRNHETCVVVATPSVLIQLQKELRSRGVNVARALAEGSYIAYDAEELVDMFMDGRALNREKFRAQVAQLFTLSSVSPRPLRIYDEVIAVLLDQRNPQAVIDLEHEWDMLMTEHPCSVYCACSEASLHELAEGEEVENLLASNHSLFFHGSPA